MLLCIQIRILMLELLNFKFDFFIQFSLIGQLGL